MPTRTSHASSTKVATPVARLGVVNFLNTVPLIDGLEPLESIALQSSVPSCLIGKLEQGEVDVALCSSIDYQRSDLDLAIVPVGVLGCDGATLTVRLYASKPIHTLKRVYCDTDSHTSVALLRILLREIYEIDPTLIDYNAREHVAENRPVEWPESMLLIGDKVVTDSPPAVRYPHQLDLGAAWANLTGHPFVFATWMCRRDADDRLITHVASVLDRQRRSNAIRLESIASAYARRSKWPVDLARTYLMEHLAYTWTPARRAGLACFYEKAAAHGLTGSPKPIIIRA